jgi:Ca2+:H+ antiporter
MSTIGLILPSYTQAVPRGSVTPIQSGAIAVLTLFLYGTFLVLQMGRHKSFFMEAEAAGETGGKAGTGSVGKHSLLLVAGILPIILLSGSLATLIDKGIAILGAPSALGGFLIAILVVSPKAISAIKAGAANQPMRALNLALGSCAPAVGLIVPVILGIGIVTGKTLIMGVGPGDAVLLGTTLLLSVVTFSGPRTTVLEGAAHLVLFFMYLVLIFSP